MHERGRILTFAIAAMVAVSLITTGCSKEKQSSRGCSSNSEASTQPDARAKELALRAQAAANLREIGKAMEFYETEIDTYPPISPDYIEPDSDGADSGSDIAESLAEIVEKHGSTPEVFVCPSETTSEEESVAQPAASQPTEDEAVEPEVEAASPPDEVDTKTAIEPKSTPATRAAIDSATMPKIGQMKLTGAILESPPDFSLFDSSSNHVTLRKWLQRIAKVRNDTSVVAVALELDSPRIGWAQAVEIAEAVKRLNKVKPVYTHITSVGPSEYLIASAGKYVSMEPTATLNIVGIGTELMFFRGTLDWIGVKPQFVHAGRFKGAGENMTRTGPSDELKENLNWLLDDLYDQLCGRIAASRGLTKGQVIKAIDQAPLAGQQALEYKFVDNLVEKADWQEHVTEATANGGDELTWVDNYAAPEGSGLDVSNPFALITSLMSPKTSKATKDPTIAIIHANGMIISGKSGQGLFGQQYVGDETISRCFDQVRKDPNVKAVVFRINSPGGSALASELMYQAIRKCAAVKPVIASIAQVGASGGYYIACGAQEIIADDVAIVGSIGVISGKLADGGVLDKLGISTFEMTRGKNAGMKLTRPWNERELGKIRELTERTYDTFIKRVKSARGEKIKKIEDVAEGRVFTARQAVKNGLVDRLGGMRESVMAARKAAGLEKSHIITLPRPKTLIDMLQGSGDVSMSGIFAGRAAIINRMVKNINGVAYMVNLAELFNEHTVLTAVPYYLNVSY